MDEVVDGPAPVEGGTTMMAQMDADSNRYATVEVDLERCCPVRRSFDEVMKGWRWKNLVKVSVVVNRGPDIGLEFRSGPTLLERTTRYDANSGMRMRMRLGSRYDKE